MLGHTIGDFYLQPNVMAERKNKSVGALLAHAAIYLCAMCAVLLAGLPFCGITWLMIGCSGALHFLVDCIKTKADKKTRYAFILDQLMHILGLLVICGIWGRHLTVNAFVSWEIAYLPALPATLLLGFLLILRPAGQLIAKGELWQPLHIPDDRAGQIIGYFERVIILFLLLYSQFTAIAFVVTAKSIFASYRYKDGKKDRKRQIIIL